MMPSNLEKDYSIQEEAEKIFRTVLLTDQRLHLPEGTRDLASRTKFDANAISEPFLPTPVKMTQSITALWALAATIANVICKERYGLDQDVVINSDAASLFLMSSAVPKVNGRDLQDKDIAQRYMKYVTGGMFQPWRRLATNIYPTKDDRWFHLHGSMNADASQNMLGAVHTNMEIAEEDAISTYSNLTKQHSAEWLDVEANDHFRQAGCICLTPEEFAESEHGKAIENDGLYLLETQKGAEPPVLWPKVSTSTYRPLEGIKMIDISRVIAGPTIAKMAALFGATVIRVSCSSRPDMGPLLVDGNLGKRDVTLNLKSAEGKETLKKLLEDADVILDGYRPGALERLGFGPKYVFELAQRRGKGIVYVRENCYGWKGSRVQRSGWQQISDCDTGVSWLQGKFFGLNEPIVPLLPNSDYQTGFIGLIGILNALHKRNIEGGSYLLSVALNYFNSFLISLGVYSKQMQEKILAKHPELHLRSYDDMIRLVSKTISSTRQAVPSLFDERHFHSIESNFGGEKPDTLTYVGPAATFEKTKLQYDVGSCFLGAYEPKWPAA